MNHLFLKFPPLLGGDGGPATYLVLVLILAFVVGVLYAVFRLLGDEREG